MAPGFSKLCGSELVRAGEFNPDVVAVNPKPAPFPRPVKRLTALTFLLWALVPSGLSLYFRLRLSPGEQWGLGLLSMILLPAWLASGLMFAFVRAAPRAARPDPAPRTRRRAVESVDRRGAGQSRRLNFASRRRISR